MLSPHLIWDCGLHYVFGTCPANDLSYLKSCTINSSGSQELELKTSWLCGPQEVTETPGALTNNHYEKHESQCMGKCIPNKKYVRVMKSP